MIEHDSTTASRRIESEIATDSREGKRTCEPPSIAVVQQLAALDDRDPVEMEPLGHRIDMDALDSLLASASDDVVEVTFDAYGRRVTVDSGGRMEVHARDPNTQTNANSQANPET